MDPVDQQRAKAILAAQGRARQSTQRTLLARILRLLALLFGGGWYDDERVAKFAEDAASLAGEARNIVADQARQVIDDLADEAGVTVPRSRAVDLEPDPVPWQKLPEQYRYHRSQGRSTDEAQAIVERLAERTVDRELTAAADDATEQRMVEIPQIIGYRRMLHPELARGGSCGLCAVASTRTYQADRLEKIHDGCHCGVLPVFEGDNTNLHEVSDRLLESLYNHAGGTDADHLARLRIVPVDGELRIRTMADEGFSQKEIRIVDYLRAQGDIVERVAPKGREPGRNPDALVNGEVTEFKSLDLGATSSTIRNRARESKSEGGQARNLIYDTRATGLDQDDAKRGINRTLGAYADSFDTIRVIGDGYDLKVEVDHGH